MKQIPSDDDVLKILPKEIRDEHGPDDQEFIPDLQAAGKASGMRFDEANLQDWDFQERLYKEMNKALLRYTGQ